MPLDYAIYVRLTEVARQQSITYYSDIAPLAGLDMATKVGRIRIAQILDDINHHESGNGRPMLSAVVILKEKNMPGAGFFDCARGLGKYNGGSDDKDRLSFWNRELAQVYGYWQLH